MFQSHASETVYTVLDDVLAGGPVPPGAKGLIYNVIDRLRCQPDAKIQIELAECISLQLHRLESTLRVGDRSATELARESLKELAACWLQGRIGGSGDRRTRLIAKAGPNARMTSTL